MPIKSLSAVAVLSCGLSACSLFNADKEELAISELPKITKASTKPIHAKAAASCSTDGFCALPGLKKK